MSTTSTYPDFPVMARWTLLMLGPARTLHLVGTCNAQEIQALDPASRQGQLLLATWGLAEPIAERFGDKTAQMWLSARTFSQDERARIWALRETTDIPRLFDQLSNELIDFMGVPAHRHPLLSNDEPTIKAH